MAMAANLARAPCAGPLSTSPLSSVAQTCCVPRSRIESRSIVSVNVNRCIPDCRVPEAASSGRDGGGVWVASSDVRIPRASIGEISWRASGLIAFDEQRFSVRRNPVATRRLRLRIAAEKPDLTNVAGTLLKLGKQGLDAGTKLVPESVPRPLAQAGVGLAGLVVGSFVLRSLFSTVTSILAIGALSYAGYFFLTKGESSRSDDRGSGGSSGKRKSTDEALEEARKIMDKYK